MSSHYHHVCWCFGFYVKPALVGDLVLTTWTVSHAARRSDAPGEGMQLGLDQGLPGRFSGLLDQGLPGRLSDLRLDQGLRGRFLDLLDQGLPGRISDLQMLPCGARQ